MINLPNRIERDATYVGMTPDEFRAWLEVVRQIPDDGTIETQQAEDAAGWCEL